MENQEKMTVYSYYIFPSFDWEFCVLSIDEYKNKISKKYLKDGEYNQRISNTTLEKVFSQIDELLSFAINDFEKQFKKGEILRTPPMIFPIPKGDIDCTAVFAVILKRDEDGDTYLYSQVPLPHLEYSGK